MALRALYDVPAPAKLNLFLHVVGRRADGYHLIDSLMLPIDWCDTLHFELRDDARLTRHDLGDPLPADDLCLRAARALQQAAGTPLGADISIEKRLPSGAGLGGGSSDAASTLLALNRLWGLDWPLSRLLPIGLALGADLPFFLGGTPARVSGIGETLTPVALAGRWFAVVKPAAGLETARVFASPQVAAAVEAARIAGFSKAERRPSDGAGKPGESEPELEDGFGRNDLQAAAEALCPEVSRAVAGLHAAFGNSRMTGSGSAVFARAGTGAAPSAAMPSDWPAGWSSRMCRSLERHPLASWARREA
ncbi:MAG: 4-(cytidine 5'-diphospho)-2-C-methyl-D-erythritol kinase [Burkholderiales bacterium]|nr:4-(cytidine 5'-diphospho)-2-C-methyl-D-erythritol kinase [Burkholderiales bacterium]